MIKTVTVQEGQTLMDLALQLTGSCSGAIDLIKLNPIELPNLSATNLTGKTIQYEEKSNDVATFFRDKKITISTRYPEFTSPTSYFSSGFSDGFTPPPDSE